MILSIHEMPEFQCAVQTPDSNHSLAKARRYFYLVPRLESEDPENEAKNVTKKISNRGSFVTRKNKLHLCAPPNQLQLALVSSSSFFPSGGFASAASVTTLKKGRKNDALSIHVINLSETEKAAIW